MVGQGSGGQGPGKSEEVTGCEEIAFFGLALTCSRPRCSRLTPETLPAESAPAFSKKPPARWPGAALLEAFVLIVLLAITGHSPPRIWKWPEISGRWSGRAEGLFPAACRARLAKRFAVDPDAVHQTEAKHDHDDEGSAVADEREWESGDRHERNGHADVLIDVKK